MRGVYRDGVGGLDGRVARLTHYTCEFILENQASAPVLKANRRLSREHQIEQVGEKLRGMIPWIKANRLVDTTKN